MKESDKVKFWDGQIDEGYILNSPITQEEANNLHNEGVPLIPKKWWQFWK